MINQQILKERLHYDPETGVFTWLPKRFLANKGGPRGLAWNEQYAGKVAGRESFSKNWCSWKIRLHGGNYPAHRLAWLYVHGTLPKRFIKHIDGDNLNNRIANLRLSAQS